MELRALLNGSFLRGLGVGMIIASLLIIGWPPGRPSMTQQQILDQARQLGMVTKEEATQKANQMVKEAQAKTKKEEEKKPQAPKPEIKPTTPPPAINISITIPKGSSSTEIGDILLKAGVINNKQEFLNFVNQKKAASRFRIGTYQLQKGMTLEELVTVLTRGR
ncbi:MAG: endolytic transglycosylase MltG [Thermincolia bacterium]